MEIEQINKIPVSSVILKDLNGEVDYLDSFKVDVSGVNTYPIDYLTTFIFTSIPKWINSLLTIRDLILKPFGIKSESIFAQSPLDIPIRYKPGDKFIYYPVIERSESEVVMAEDDKHLYFRMSVLRDNLNSARRSMYITTIIQFHSRWSRIYFIPLKPFHKLILKSLLLNFRNRCNELSTQS